MRIFHTVSRGFFLNPIQSSLSQRTINISSFILFYCGVVSRIIRTIAKKYRATHHASKYQPTLMAKMRLNSANPIEMTSGRLSFVILKSFISIVGC